MNGKPVSMVTILKKPSYNVFKLTWRIIFGILLGVEVLAYFNLIQLSPTYTTFGLILTSIFVWSTMEITQLFLEKNGKTHHYGWWIILCVAAVLYLDAMGDFLHFYESIPNYDGFLHFLTPAIIAWWMWQILTTIYPTATHQLLVLTTGSLSITLTVLYEIEEYLEDVFTGSHRLGDGFDTANDLLMGVIGVSVVVTLLYSLKRNKVTNNH